MLNYIWAGLIILSLGFALVQDGYDLANNTYGNGEPRTVYLEFPPSSEPEQRVDVPMRIPKTDTTITATWRPMKKATELIIPVGSSLPEQWRTIAENQKSEDKETLRATVQSGDPSSGRYEIILPKVRFVKLRAITQAAFDMAEFAVKLVIGLIGAMALWLGLMNIAEKSGLIHVFNRMVRPVLKYLFPKVPKDHPALSAISLNMAANVLGLGNAATPLGIKAMEELQKLNDEDDTATDAMCMFLAINTSSVQLLPPVTLVALMGTGVNEIMIGIILATLCSTIAGIAAAKWFAYRRRRQRTTQSNA